jgi:hypothetical protein
MEDETYTIIVNVQVSRDGYKWHDKPHAEQEIRLTLPGKMRLWGEFPDSLIQNLIRRTAGEYFSKVAEQEADEAEPE